MSRLTDRRGGFVADQMRRRTDGTAAYRLAEAERRLDRMEHAIAYRMRAFRGVRIESTGVQIEPDGDGFLAFSSDSNLKISRNPNTAQNHAKWELTAEIPEDGCTAAIATITDCATTSQTATQCGASLTFGDPQDVAAKHAGTENAQVLNLYVAFDTDSPNIGQQATMLGAPDTMLLIGAGDPCDPDNIVYYAVPGWATT